MLSPTRNTRQKPSNGTFAGPHCRVGAAILLRSKGGMDEKGIARECCARNAFDRESVARSGSRGEGALGRTWTGCYVGTHVGGGWADETITAPAIVPGVSVTGHTAGVLGGGQVGCNLQFARNWVIGIEGEGSAADIKGDTNQTILGIT
jgi:hypothetical protein